MWVVYALLSALAFIVLREAVTPRALIGGALIAAGTLVMVL